MAKKKRPTRRPPRHRHLSTVPSGPTPKQLGNGIEDQALFQSLRRGLRSDEPLDLLAQVCGVIEAADQRNCNPFDPDDHPGVSLHEMAESFMGLPYAETTATLTVLRALLADEVLGARIDRELATRRHPLPIWLAELARARVEPVVWRMRHILGDGDNYLLDMPLAGGAALTAIIYVDHNMGTIVKDAFLLPDTVESVLARMRETSDDPDTTFETVDPAGARAIIEAAVDRHARLLPPHNTDSWPMCRPLVEAMVRQLPAGAQMPDAEPWTDEQIAELSDAFFASPFGHGLDHPDARSLVESLVWFGDGYSGGDPLRWSPTTVEVLMVDWLPRKLVADVAFLARLPELLRAFVRYSHDRRGIRAALTQDTLGAIGRYEPEYQRLIRGDRPQGPAALLAQMLLDRGEFADDEFDLGTYLLERLGGAVGGRQQLMGLDADPLPDEPFVWAGVPEDIRPVVQEHLRLCDSVADQLLDVEHRTAMRRLLGRAAVGDPQIFRRRSSASRGAAAVAWVICRANDTVGATSSGLAVQELLAAFDVTGSVSQRAEPMLRAIGVNPHDSYGNLALGAVDLLVSAKRADIIHRRDCYLAEQSR